MALGFAKSHRAHPGDLWWLASASLCSIRLRQGGYAPVCRVAATCCSEHKHKAPLVSATLPRDDISDKASDTAREYDGEVLPARLASWSDGRPLS